MGGFFVLNDSIHAPMRERQPAKQAVYLTFVYYTTKKVNKTLFQLEIGG